jgi:RNA polymerase sigma-70 factor, ECF subfamily
MMNPTISQEAFETEAMPHLKDLYRTALRLVRNQTEAEDLVQEVFMQAWKSFEIYEAGTNCRAWLYKILFFKIGHYRRRFYLQSKRFQNLDEDESVLNNAVYEESLAENLTDEEVIAAVDALPMRFREVIMLTDVEEFSYKEAAEILNIPIGTVMSRLSRARAALRQSLTEVAPQYGIKIPLLQTTTKPPCVVC